MAAMSPASDVVTGFSPVIVGKAQTHNRGRSDKSCNINGTTASPSRRIS